MDSIGKKLLLSAGIGVGVAISSATLYLLLKPDDEDQPSTTTDADQRKVHQSTQSVVTVRVPRKFVGVVIGRGGEQIKQIQVDTNTRMNFDDNHNTDQTNTRLLIIKGSPEGTAKAETIINDIIRLQSLVSTKTFTVETASVGAIIGRNGSTIRGLCDKSGAKIKVDRNNRNGGPKANTISTSVAITGTEEQIEEAVLLINNEIMRNETFNRSQQTSYKSVNNYKVLAIQDDTSFNKALSLDNYFAKLEPTNEYHMNEVFVSAVKSPDEFYLQMAGSRAKELDSFMDEITDFYENEDNRICFKPLSVVKVGDIVAVPYQADEHWYRARVVSMEDKPYSLEDSNVSIFYLDYGDEAVIKYNQICELKDQFLKQLPFQAMECSLSGVRPKNGLNWSEEAIDRFKELSHMALWKSLFVKVIGVYKVNDKKDKYQIELIDKMPNNHQNDDSKTNDDDWDDKPAAKPLNIGHQLIDEDFAVLFEVTDDNDCTDITMT